MTNTSVKAAFFGDSIFYGYQTDYDYRCWKVFEKTTGIEVVSSNNENPMGFPGAGIFDLVNLIDNLLIRYSPDYIFLSIGANHFDPDGILRWPHGTGEDLFFDSYSILFDKLARNKIEVIWAGIPPLEGGGDSQEMALEWSYKIDEIAKGFDFKSSFFTSEFIKMSDWDAMGGPYYGNLALDIHPNNRGQEFIGKCLGNYFLDNM